MPTAATNPYGGIFQYLVHINGTDAEVRQAQAALAKLTPTTAAVYQALNLLPEGNLKNWLMANPVQFWKGIWTAIFGRHWTSGDYTLGQSLNENIYCSPHITQSQVSDDMVVAAHNVFNQLFGIRISTNDDLNAIKSSPADYRTREASQGISDAAIDRAFFIMQQFLNAHATCWDLSLFEKYPLVAPIPDYDLGKWYTGPLIGGASAVDGIIPVDISVLKQLLGADFNPVTGEVTPAGGTTGSSTFSDILSKIKANPAAALLIAGGIGFAINELSTDDE